MRKQERYLRSLAREYGLTLVMGKRSGHAKFFDSEGRLVCSTGSTPSDRRTGKNLEAQLRRVRRDA